MFVCDRAIVDYHTTEIFKIWPEFNSFFFWNKNLKALANEDTNVSRARNICCGHKFCFPDTKKCFWLCSATFCVRSKCFSVCAVQETSWTTMCPQQCVLVCQGIKTQYNMFLQRAERWLINSNFNGLGLIQGFSRTLWLVNWIAWVICDCISFSFTSLIWKPF